MSCKIKFLEKLGLANPPKWLTDNVIYEAITGSMAYGFSIDNSDQDLYSICVPPKRIIFPHTENVVVGFDKNNERFNQFQKHNIYRADNKQNYDITCYNIVDYCRLLMENNPNIIDSIFVPGNCITHQTPAGTILRDNRRLFLHKGCYHKYIGYAFSQMHKCQNVSHKKYIQDIRKFEQEHEIPHFIDKAYLEEEITLRNLGKPLTKYLGNLSHEELLTYERLWENGLNETKRFYLQKRYNSDVKNLSHVVRLLDFGEQILTNGDLDVQRPMEKCKAIRRGEVSAEEIKSQFVEKEKHLTKLYQDSKIPHRPNEKKLKSVMLSAIEEHWGTLDGAIENRGKYEELVRNIQELVNRKEYL